MNHRCPSIWISCCNFRPLGNEHLLPCNWWNTISQRCRAVNTSVFFERNVHMYIYNDMRKGGDSGLKFTCTTQRWPWKEATIKAVSWSPSFAVLAPRAMSSFEAIRGHYVKSYIGFQIFVNYNNVINLQRYCWRCVGPNVDVEILIFPKARNPDAVRRENDVI